MAATKKAKPARSDATGVYVALLRGINVGGKNKLPMSSLVAAFTETGCANVRTYIQSGNVVFSAAPNSSQRRPGPTHESTDEFSKQLSDRVATRIADRFGLQVPVVLRTADEFRRIAASNPFLKSDADVGSLHVGFLADPPAPSDVKALDPNRSPGDSFEVRGREIYLQLPNGVAGSKLTNHYIDSTLGTTSTFRNWRTVLKLAEIVQSMRL